MKAHTKIAVILAALVLPLLLTITLLQDEEPIESIEVSPLFELDIVPLPDRTGVVIGTEDQIILWKFGSDEKLLFSLRNQGRFAKIGAVGNESALLVDREGVLMLADYDTLEFQELKLPRFDRLTEFAPIDGGFMLVRTDENLFYWSPDEVDTLKLLDYREPPTDILQWNFQPSRNSNQVLNYGTDLSIDRLYGSYLLLWNLDTDSETFTLEDSVVVDEPKIYWTLGNDGRVWGAGQDPLEFKAILWEAGKDPVKLPIPYPALRIIELPNDVLAVSYENNGLVDTGLIDRKSLDPIRQIENTDFDEPILIDGDRAVVAASTLNLYAGVRTKRQIQLWNVDDLTHR